MTDQDKKDILKFAHAMRGIALHLPSQGIVKIIVTEKLMKMLEEVAAEWENSAGAILPEKTIMKMGPFTVEQERPCEPFLCG
jgi:hypothetical protein